MHWANPWALWFLPPVIILVTWLHLRRRIHEPLVLFSAIRLLKPEIHAAHRRFHELRHWLLYVLRLTALLLIITAFAQPKWNDVDLPSAMPQPAPPAQVVHSPTLTTSDSFAGDVILVSQRAHQLHANWPSESPAYAIDRVLKLFSKNTNIRNTAVTTTVFSQFDFAQNNPSLLVIVEPARLDPTTVNKLSDALQQGTNVLYLATNPVDADNLNVIYQVCQSAQPNSVRFKATNSQSVMQRQIVNRQSPFANHRHDDWIELIESVHARQGVIALSTEAHFSNLNIIIGDNVRPVLCELPLAIGRLMLLNIDTNDSSWFNHPAWVVLISELVNDLVHRPTIDEPPPTSVTQQIINGNESSGINTHVGLSRIHRDAEPWVYLSITALICLAAESLLACRYSSHGTDR